jgi:hypothetical protein
MRGQEFGGWGLGNGNGSAEFVPVFLRGRLHRGLGLNSVVPARIAIAVGRTGQRLGSRVNERILADSVQKSISVLGQRPIRRIHFEQEGAGKVDLYVPFVERAFSLLSQNAILGYIVPNKFLQSDYGIKLRDLISRRRVIEAG